MDWNVLQIPGTETCFPWPGSEMHFSRDRSRGRGRGWGGRSGCWAHPWLSYLDLLGPSAQKGPFRMPSPSPPARVSLELCLPSAAPWPCMAVASISLSLMAVGSVRFPVQKPPSQLALQPDPMPGQVKLPRTAMAFQPGTELVRLLAASKARRRIDQEGRGGPVVRALARDLGSIPCSITDDLCGFGQVI